MSSSEERVVQLISGDGEFFAAPLDVALLSKLVETMFDPDLPEDEEQQIPLPEVKAATLARVIEFATHYKQDPFEAIEKPLKSTDMKEIVPEWYANFVSVEHEPLFEMILAANFMDIKPLLDLTCATVASMIKGKNSEEIRLHFNIEDRSTGPVDEALVREQCKWCEED